MTIIGQPVVRTDAIAKVRGHVRYPADIPVPNVVHAVLVTSSVARGRITRLNSADAEALPGVRLVLTHANVGPLAADPSMVAGGRFQSSFNPLGSDAVAYHGQIVAVVVAETLETAEHAASLVQVDYDIAPAQAEVGKGLVGAEILADVSLDKGDVEKAFATAPVTIDSTYHVAAMHQNPIELYSTTAIWTGDRLHLDLPSQWIIGTQVGVAAALGIPTERVSVASAYIGGAFGAKASVFWHTVFAAVAAKRTARPVRLIASRTQGFTIGSFRPESRHHVRLAANRDGTLVAYDHEVRSQSSRADLAALPGTHYSTHIYSAPNIRAREFVVRRDVNTPGYMRGPMEYQVNFAQESALDELAIALKMDPVELRLANDAVRDPVSGLPYSSRSLGRCLRRGAELFGWAKRNAGIGSMHADDGQLIGMGCAAGWYPVYRAASQASLRLTADGRAEIGVSATDLGTGAYTILRQIAAEDLGLPVGSVIVKLGSSDLPVGPMAAGSSTTASAGSAVRLAARTARRTLLAAAVRSGPLKGSDPASLGIANGDVVAPDGRRVTVATLVRAMPNAVLQEKVEWAPRELDQKKVRDSLGGKLGQAGPFGDTHTMFSFGAQFAEVCVDPLTRRVTLARLVGTFAAGRIINPRTAHSQLMGGMIWGASHGLMEEAVVDIPRARFANTDLGGYHFATNADIRDVVVEMLHEEDKEVNLLGAKGVGELGVIGVAPAIANAVHHATGVRVRKTPILIDDVIVAS